MGLNYYILDTETTGLQAGWHEIIEISIIRCSDKAQLTKKIKAEFPSRANYQALQICGLTKSDLYRGEDKHDVVKRCETFWEEDGLTPEHRCLVAHNASFDKRFCHALWASVGKRFPVVCWLDTIKLTKEWANKVGQGKMSFKLASALSFAGIEALPGEHTAGADARNTYMLWEKGMAQEINYLKAIKRWPHGFGTENLSDIED